MNGYNCASRMRKPRRIRSRTSRALRVGATVVAVILATSVLTIADDSLMVKSTVLSSGGLSGTDGPRVAKGTLGQPLVGPPGLSTTHSVRHGFWVDSSGIDSDPSPGVLIGHTWLDMQHTGSMGRMVDWYDPSEGHIVHMTWGAIRGDPQEGFGNRGWRYNAGWPSSGALLGGVWVTPDSVSASSPNVVVPCDGRAIVGGTSDHCGFYRDQYPAGGVFEPMCSGDSGIGSEYAWPKFCIQVTPGYDSVLHVFMQESGGYVGAPMSLVYFRKVGIGSGGVWDQPYFVDTVFDVSHDLICSQTSGKVALVWTANLCPDLNACDTCSDNSGSFALINPTRENDLYYQVSQDYGATWQPRVNLTKNRQDQDGLRPYSDLSVLITSDTYVHIGWAATTWQGNGGLGGNNCHLLYWSEDIGGSTGSDGYWRCNQRMVVDLDWDQTTCASGAWNMNGAKMSISECNGKLYYLWVQYNDIPNGIEDDCAQRAWQGDVLGSANGELFLSVSQDLYGLSWSTPFNLTNTYSPHCDGEAGECESENWPSMARYCRYDPDASNHPERVVDPSGMYTGDYYLDVIYIDDADPGAVVNDEGSWQLADVRWFQLAAIDPPSPQPPTVIATDPEREELNVPVDASIQVSFDCEMDPTTINDSTIIVSSNLTGRYPCSISYESSTWSVTIDPTIDFTAGERITVTLTDNIRGQSGIALAASYEWSFTAAVRDKYYCSFFAYSSESLDHSPDALVAGDFNGDGYADIAVVGGDTYPPQDSTISIILFDPSTYTIMLDSTYVVGLDPGPIVATDLNGDGYLDLATTNCDAYGLSVLLNVGDGTFHPTVYYSIGGDSCSLASGDFDGDGDQDMVVGCSDSDDLWFLQNQGDGSFQLSSTLPIAGSPYHLVVADLNNDGLTDLAVATNDPFPAGCLVYVYLNNNQGTFTNYSEILLDCFITSLHAADLDGDGDLELVTTSDGSDVVTILVNDGAADFVINATYEVGDSPFELTVVDVDGDGDLDLAIANGDGNSLSVLLNDGDGSFELDTMYTADGTLQAICMADVDRNGGVDVVTATAGPNEAKILWNLFSGTCGDFNVPPGGDCVSNIADLTFLIAYLYGGGPPPEPLCLADVNCDGAVNIADLTYMIDYLYGGGPPPCSDCCSPPWGNSVDPKSERLQAVPEQEGR